MRPGPPGASAPPSTPEEPRQADGVLPATVRTLPGEARQIANAETAQIARQIQNALA